MEAGQLVATPLKADDTAKLVDQYPDRFHVLVSFAQELPTLGRDFIASNEATLEAHPGIVEAFIREKLLVTRELYENPDSVSALAAEHLEFGEAAEVVGKYYLDNKLWCTNGGLEDTNLAESLTYFAEYGFIEAGHSAAEFLAPGPLSGVLDEIGRSDLTEC
jgi:hypothetical protein